MNQRRLIAFINISIDGYYADANDGVQWAYKSPHDTEWNTFVSENASGGGVLVMGHRTYDMMASYWPTPMAQQNDPVVARGMNAMQKIVFSRRAGELSWENSRRIETNDIAASTRALKMESGPGMAILGSGSIVRQLTHAGLLDELQLVVNPVLLGQGKRLFDGDASMQSMSVLRTRTFNNGNVLLCYAPA